MPRFAEKLCHYSVFEITSTRKLDAQICRGLRFNRANSLLDLTLLAVGNFFHPLAAFFLAKEKMLRGWVIVRSRHPN